MTATLSSRFRGSYASVTVTKFFPRFNGRDTRQHIASRQGGSAADMSKKSKRLKEYSLPVSRRFCTF